MEFGVRYSCNKKRTGKISGRRKQLKPKKRIALFGGTFDPPHRAHIELIHQVQQELQFQKIWIIPSKYPPGKNPIASYDQRLKWCREVFKFSPCVVSDLEAKSSQTVFAREIYNQISLLDPEAEYYWILGTDQFEQLPYWNHIDEYAFQLTWVVLSRENQSAFPSFKGLGSRRLQRSSCAYLWADIKAMPGISSSEIREKLNEEPRLLDSIPSEIRVEVEQYYKQSAERGKT